MRARAILFAIAMLSGCSGLTVRDTFDHGTSFATYRSFTWVSATHPLLVASALPVDPRLEGFLMHATQETLQSKGYEYVADAQKADFLLGFRIGTAAPSSPDYPSPYGGLDDEAALPGIANELNIDIYDARSRRAVWRGTAQKDVTGRDQVRAEATIRHVVEAVLARFPPR